MHAYIHAYMHACMHTNIYMYTYNVIHICHAMICYVVRLFWDYWNRLVQDVLCHVIVWNAILWYAMPCNADKCLIEGSRQRLDGR